MKKIAVLVVLTFGILCIASPLTAQTANVAGEWDVAMNTPGGVRNFKVIFQVDGEKLSGTVKRSAGDVPLTGTIKGNDIQFGYTVKYGDNDLAITMSGKVDGDAMAGTVSFAGQAEDQWSAKRAAKTDD